MIKQQKMAIIKVNAGEIKLYAEVEAGDVRNITTDWIDPWHGLAMAIKQDSNHVVEFIREIDMAIKETRK